MKHYFEIGLFRTKKRKGGKNMLAARAILEKALSVVNDTWDTQYMVINGSVYDITHASHICRIDDLKWTLIGNDVITLDFGDDTPVILTPQGYDFPEIKNPLTVTSSQEATEKNYAPIV